MFPSISSGLSLPLFSVILCVLIISLNCRQNPCRDGSHDMKSLQRMSLDSSESLLLIDTAICQCVSQCPEMTHRVFTAVPALEGRVRNWKFLATGKTNVIPAQNVYCWLYLSILKPAFNGLSSRVFMTLVYKGIKANWSLLFACFIPV